MLQQFTVLIADDQPRARQALRALLATWPAAIVIAEAGDGLEAVRAARAAQPELVLLDVRMPGISGIAATMQIKLERPSTRIVVLSIYADFEERALAAGADAFLNKADVPGLLLPTVARLMQTEG